MKTSLAEGNQNLNYNKLGIILLSIFLFLVAFYLLIMKPEKYIEKDAYDSIMNRGYIRIGVHTDSKPFGFYDKDGILTGYDIELAKYIAEYILGTNKKIEFVPVTPNNRLLKISTGDVDIVIATLTITPQRQQIINFSTPYDSARLAILVRKTSKISSISDLSGQSVGVVWGTTAEKNMGSIVPNANVVGFKSYAEAYSALKKCSIDAITSDDTILSRFVMDDNDVMILPKKYSREPYGIGFKQGKGSDKLKKTLDEAISDLKQKNVIIRLHKKWLGE